MCRNIKPLFNFDPPAIDDEIRAAAQQFVRKISGFHEPSKVNAASFEMAIDRVALAAKELVQSLHTDASPKNREEEAAKAHAKAVERFSKLD